LTLPYNDLLVSQGSANQNFIWGNGLLSASAPDSNFHYLHDHLGSPIRLLDTNSGDATMVYDEFGVQEVAATSFQNPFGFTGYQTDSVSGLHFAQARCYAPDIGRFTAEDIIKGYITNPTSLNAYTYCYNSPHIYVDLDGMSASSVFEMPNINLNALFANLVIYITDILKPDYVVGVGVSGTVAVVVGSSSQFNAVADPQGNVGGMLFAGAGAASPQISGNANAFVTPGADRIHDLGHVFGEPGTFRGAFGGVVGGSATYKGMSIGVDAIHNLYEVTTM